MNEEFVERGQPADRVISEIAARQHGLITRAQLLRTGMAADTVRWRVRSGRLLPVHRGVYQVGPVVGPRAREWAAVLACGPGVVVSHRSAAVLWQLCADRGSADLVDITVAHGDRGRRHGIRAHRVRTLRPADTTELDGIPVTTLTRTLFDLATQASSTELRQALALASRRADMNRAELLELISGSAKRRGVPLLRALLQDESAPALTRSEAEERMLRPIRRAQLPRPEVNAQVESYEVDFVWRVEGLVVEVDGFAFHSSRPRFENDRRRDAMLAAWGYRVMRVTWRQIVSEPETLLVRLTQALTTVHRK